MEELDILTQRERQVAEFLAWGASAKEVPDLLVSRYGGQEISVNTVRNTAANIFTKLHINKVSELSAWWFCNVEGVDSSHSPIQRRIYIKAYSILMLLIMIPSIFNMDQAIRPQRTGAARVTRVVRSARRKD